MVKWYRNALKFFVSSYTAHSWGHAKFEPERSQYAKVENRRSANFQDCHTILILRSWNLFFAKKKITLRNPSEGLLRGSATLFFFSRKKGSKILRSRWCDNLENLQICDFQLSHTGFFRAQIWHVLMNVLYKMTQKISAHSDIIWPYFQKFQKPRFYYMGIMAKVSHDFCARNVRDLSGQVESAESTGRVRSWPRFSDRDESTC